MSPTSQNHLNSSHILINQLLRSVDSFGLATAQLLSLKTGILLVSISQCLGQAFINCHAKFSMITFLRQKKKMWQKNDDDKFARKCSYCLVQLQKKTVLVCDFPICKMCKIYIVCCNISS